MLCFSSFFSFPPSALLSTLVPSFSVFLTIALVMKSVTRVELSRMKRMPTRKHTSKRCDFMHPNRTPIRPQDHSYNKQILLYRLHVRASYTNILVRRNQSNLHLFVPTKIVVLFMPLPSLPSKRSTSLFLFLCMLIFLLCFIPFIVGCECDHVVSERKRRPTKPIRPPHSDQYI